MIVEPGAADEHEQILEAVVSGDARGAQTLTRRHISDAIKRFLSAVGKVSDDLLAATRG